MRFLYISFLNEDIRSGYKYKIHSQCEGLKRCGYDGELFIFGNDGFSLYTFSNDCKNNKKQLIQFKHKRMLQNRNMYDEFWTFLQFIDEIKKIIKNGKYDLVYIRRIVPITPMLIYLLKFIHKFKNINILYEYPTYPWKEDMKYLSRASRIYYFIDNILYKLLISNVDYIVCYGKYFGNNKKFIEAKNGIFIQDFPTLIKSKKNNSEFHFIAVANVSEIHGYDRLIKGISEYYKNKYKINVYFHIVGNVSPSLHLDKLVDSLKLNEKIIFHGYKNGKELDDLFNLMDCGVDTLAYYRRGKNCVSGSLKSREYLARGLPFIFSGNLDIFSSDLEFMINIPIEPEVINVNEVIDKIHNLKASSNVIREYAEKNLSWELIMKDILEKTYKL